MNPSRDLRNRAIVEGSFEVRKQNRKKLPSHMFPMRGFEELTQPFCQIYSGSIEGVINRSISITPLRLYLQYVHSIDLFPLARKNVEFIRQRYSDLDYSLIAEKGTQAFEPIIIALDFLGPKRHDIIDGNHTVIALAQGFEKAGASGMHPDTIMGEIPAYIVRPHIWRDFLVDPISKFPLSMSAMHKRVSAAKARAASGQY